MPTIILTIITIALTLFILRFVAYWFVEEYTAPIPPAKEGTVRVACVGDSITYGSLVRNRAQNCYPAQLERLLGEEYSVRNFAVNGHTLMHSGDKPFWKHKNFKRSTEFAPDIVLIMLGTNDTKAYNWTCIGEYIADYREMVAHYALLPSRPKVYVLTPPVEFVVKGSHKVKFGMSNDIMNEIVAALKEMAETDNLPVIDINAATKDHPECFQLDGIHPNRTGDTVIARTVYEALTSK